MAVLGILFQVAKQAVLQVVTDSKNQSVPPVFTEIYNNRKQKRKPTTLELKTHELVTILSQLISSVFSLIKLIRFFFPNSLWKSPNQ